MLTDNANRFLTRHPYCYGTIRGYSFYECPIYGDETDLKCITPEGKLISTSEYEWDHEELDYWITRREA